MIGDLGDTIGSSVLQSIGRTIGRAQERRPLPVDLLESDDAYLAVFDAPGALSSDVQVRYDDDRIVVRIDRFREFREGYEMQFPGRGLTLDGQVELPPEANVDPTRGTATLKDDGTLHVEVPKVDDGDDGSDAESEADGNSPGGERDAGADGDPGTDSEGQDA